MARPDPAIGTIPADWQVALGAAASPEALDPIAAFVAEQRALGSVFPDREHVFAALAATTYAAVRAVILGQDPYPAAGHAEGLAFSVPDDVRPLPPSLRNILAELHADLGFVLPDGGSLAPWARHGVLLLNTVLTVREGGPGSHRGQGWEALTDAIVAAVVAKDEPVAFLLWGKHAQVKGRLINERRHVVLRAAHPSPLSARRGFLGTRPFSTANRELVRRGALPVDWGLAGPDGSRSRRL